MFTGEQKPTVSSQGYSGIFSGKQSTTPSSQGTVSSIRQLFNDAPSMPPGINRSPSTSKQNSSPIARPRAVTQTAESSSPAKV